MKREGREVKGKRENRESEEKKGEQKYARVFDKCITKAFSLFVQGKYPR